MKLKTILQISMASAAVCLLSSCGTTEVTNIYPTETKRIYSGPNNPTPTGPAVTGVRRGGSGATTSGRAGGLTPVNAIR